MVYGTRDYDVNRSYGSRMQPGATETSAFYTSRNVFGGTNHNMGMKSSTHVDPIDYAGYYANQNRPLPRVKPEAAEIAEKAKGCVGVLLANYGKPEPYACAMRTGDGLKPEIHSPSYPTCNSRTARNAQHVPEASETLKQLIAANALHHKQIPKPRKEEKTCGNVKKMGQREEKMEYQQTTSDPQEAPQWNSSTRIRSAPPRASRYEDPSVEQSHERNRVGNTARTLQQLRHQTRQLIDRCDDRLDDTYDHYNRKTRPYSQQRGEARNQYQVDSSALQDHIPGNRTRHKCVTLYGESRDRVLLPDGRYRSAVNHTLENARVRLGTLGQSGHSESRQPTVVVNASNNSHVYVYAPGAVQQSADESTRGGKYDRLPTPYRDQRDAVRGRSKRPQTAYDRYPTAPTPPDEDYARPSNPKNPGRRRHSPQPPKHPGNYYYSPLPSPHVRFEADRSDSLFHRVGDVYRNQPHDGSGEYHLQPTTAEEDGARYDRVARYDSRPMSTYQDDFTPEKSNEHNYWRSSTQPTLLEYETGVRDWSSGRLQR